MQPSYSVHAARCALAAAVALLGSACASYRSPAEVEQMLSRATALAQERHAEGMDSEATVLIQAISSVDPAFAGVRELEASIDPAIRAQLDRGWLGMNRRPRPEVERPWPMRVALWPADRALDLMDVLHVGIHVGAGAFLDYHVTREVAVTVGARSTVGLGLFELRTIGLKSVGEGGMTFLSYGHHSNVTGLAGTSGVHGGADVIERRHRPSSHLYQELRDYWGVGATGILGFIGAEIELHPVQFADFLGGFVGIDFLNDDFAHTRGLRFEHGEPDLLLELVNVRRSQRTLEAYRRGKLADETMAEGKSERRSP